MNKRIVVIILIILLLGILFPFAALSHYYSGYAIVFNSIFETLLSHILMHGALFAALSWIILRFQQGKPGGRKIVFCLLGVLLVALAQESIQAISVGNLRVNDSLFDLGVDLVFASIPPVIDLILTNSRSRKVVR